MDPCAPCFYPEWAKPNAPVANEEHTRKQTVLDTNKSVGVSEKTLRLISAFNERHGNSVIDDLAVGNDLSEYMVDLHDRIAKSEKPNYLGLRIPVQSTLNITFLRQALNAYTDNVICEFLEFGFPLGTSGLETRNAKPPRNHSGAEQYPAEIEKYLQSELLHGSIIGPFCNNPFNNTPMFLSPLNSVPKSEATERRIILDLSFPKGLSVNDHISKYEYLGDEIRLKFPSVDDLVDIVRVKGQGCLLFKRDLKRAYRQIPLDPGDINKVGFRWRKQIFFDRVLSMGSRSAAHMCQRVTSAIVHIVSDLGFKIVNYLDDLAGAENGERADVAFRTLGNVLQSAGLVESSEKAWPPSEQMPFLGVWFDTQNLTLSITGDRLREIQSLVISWLDRNTANVTELQSLLGKLHFVSHCVRPGRLFVNRLLQWLRTLPPGEPDKVYIPEEVKLDLKWWHRFLPLYNGVSMMAMEQWSCPDSVMATDACLSACGGWSPQRKEYFHANFPPGVTNLDLHINCLELLAIVVAVKMWGVHLVGRRMLMQCDNQASVWALNTGRCKDAFMLSCLREILFYSSLWQFEVRSVHCPGADNRIPDLLSRWEIDKSFQRKFLEETKNLGLTEVEVDQAMFDISHDR